MACSSTGASSGSSALRSSSSEEDLQQMMDQRKRKRMQSNRESARRSRMRKQKHLDDLMAQVSQLSKENNQILTSMTITSQLYSTIEAENSVLRAQVTELSHRLQSLNEIVDLVSSGCNGAESAGVVGGHELFDQISGDDGFMAMMMNPWEDSLFVNQPIMAATDYVPS